MTTKKIITTSGIILAILILGAAIFIFLLADSWIEDRIKSELSNIKDADITYKSIDLDVLSGHFTMLNGSLKQKNQQNNHYNVSFDTLKIDGLGTFSYIFNDKIKLNRITVNSPHLQYIKVAGDTTSKEKTEVQLPDILVKKILLKNGSFGIKNREKDNENTLVEGNFSLSATELTADSTQEHQYGKFGLESLNADLNDISYHFPDSLFKADVKSFSYSLKKGSISIDSTHITSKYDKYELAHQIGHEIDWIDIYNPQTEIKGLNPSGLIAGIYDISSITINGLNARLFRDKRLPFPDKPDTKLLFQVMADMPVNINIDTIMLKDAKIQYQEHVKQGGEPGIMTFNNLYASIYNITNIDSIGKKVNYTAKMDAQANVMGSSLLKVSFSLPLIESEQPATVSGNIEDMDLTVFNPMLEQVAFVRIDAGHLISLDFNFNYNTERSDGKMYFRYKNLNISTLDKESNTAGGTGEQIKSFIANTFVIKTNNLKENDDFRVGEISYTRNKKKSVFNYWWKSLLSGFRSTIGLPEMSATDT